MTGRLAGRRVLVVEDDPDVRRFLEFALGTQGCAVRPAGSALEALALARAERFDLVLSDVCMPGEGEALALPAALPGVPVVLLTGHATLGEAAARARGAAALLRKPVELDDLLATVARALDEGGPTR